MNKKEKLSLVISVVFALLFLIITILVKTVDVKQIGAGDTYIGLSLINGNIFNYFGVNMVWYHITDWLGFVPLITAAAFGVEGLIQLIKRKKILKVDKSLLVLGVYYIIVIAVYIFFEIVVINYRPILLSNNPEASFPSSHTFIALSIMSTAIYQFDKLVKNKKLQITFIIFSILVMTVTVIGRLISGVHWFTDVFAGIILSISFSLAYYFIVNIIEKKN